MKTYIGGPLNAETLKLYRNNHDGTFEDVTEQVGLERSSCPWGRTSATSTTMDIWTYIWDGPPSYTALLPHVLLRNDAGKKFVDITQSSGTGELHKGHGIAFADLSAARQRRHSGGDRRRGTGRQTYDASI